MVPNRFDRHIGAMMTTHPDHDCRSLVPTSPLMRVTGAEPGPRLVVTGPRHTIEPLATRLWSLPGLATIRGSLILREDSQSTDFDYPDNVLNLNAESGNAYQRTCARMASLGMISNGGMTLDCVA